MVVSVVAAGFIVAVTVVEPPVSAMVASASVIAKVTACVPSLSRMVPTPIAVPSVALVGLLSCTRTVSSASSVVSGRMETVTSLLVSLAAKVSLPPVNAV